MFLLEKIKARRQPELGQPNLNLDRTWIRQKVCGLSSGVVGGGGGGEYVRFQFELGPTRTRFFYTGWAWTDFQLGPTRPNCTPSHIYKLIQRKKNLLVGIVGDTFRTRIMRWHRQLKAISRIPCKGFLHRQLNKY